MVFVSETIVNIFACYLMNTCVSFTSYNIKHLFSFNKRQRACSIYRTSSIDRKAPATSSLVKALAMFTSCEGRSVVSAYRLRAMTHPWGL